MLIAKRSTKTYQTWWKDIFAILFTLGVLFFALLNHRPLFVPDEGRYAEIAREMFVSGNYVTPYLNGIKYFEKPILFYWLCVGAIKALGLNIWSLRSVNAFLALVCCLLTYVTCRNLYSRKSGLLAAFILGTSSLYFVMSQMISLDLTVTCFLSASLYCFILGYKQPLGPSRRYFIWAAFAFSALAVLTKGLIGIVFPIMIVGSWIALTKQWGLLTRLYLPSGILVFLFLVSPWHILVTKANPEFFHFYFIEQHFLRYTTEDIGHYQPAWFFLPVICLGFFPWIIFLPQAIGHSFKNKGQTFDFFFLLWATLIFIFFSFSKSKLIPYILPAFPPLAIMTARYLEQVIRYERKQPLAIIIFTTFAVAIAYIFYSLPQQVNLPDAKTARLWLTLASGTLVSTIILYWFWRHKIKQWLMMLVANAILFLLLLMSALPSIDTRTILPLTQVLEPIIQPDDVVITYNQYYQDLPFYLQRRVSILNWRNELLFGMQHQKNTDWLLDDTVFWQLWHSQKRIYLILSISEYKQLKTNYPQEHFYHLSQTLTNALITNQKS